MRLRYELRDAGWADVTVGCGQQEVEMRVSYFHDSLRDLAGGARALTLGASEVRVVFMDEPGEHELVLRRGSRRGVELELLWHEDWKSWGNATGPANLRLSGTTSVAHVHGQVLSELHRLLQENGEAGYLEKWVEHPFPVAEMRALEAAVEQGDAADGG